MANRITASEIDSSDFKHLMEVYRTLGRDEVKKEVEIMYGVAEGDTPELVDDVDAFFEELIDIYPDWNKDEEAAYLKMLYSGPLYNLLKEISRDVAVPMSVAERIVDKLKSKYNL